MSPHASSGKFRDLTTTAEEDGDGGGGDDPNIVASILPFSFIVGQDELRRGLELCFIAPQIGGALVHGERGTAKSTIVRSFALMAYGHLPVTLPLNATDDRIMGGYRIEALLGRDLEKHMGLLEEANGSILYVDEVNLLDDHVINILLDTVSTGILNPEREAYSDKVRVSFALVATMNPDEGGLRAQLLDRFGLLVPVTADNSAGVRAEILRTVLRFEAESALPGSAWINEGRQKDADHKTALEQARERYAAMQCPDEIAWLCAKVAEKFEAAGHRAELVMARAACALAALDRRTAPRPEDVREIARLALVHRRRPQQTEGESWSHDDGLSWSASDEALLQEVFDETVQDGR